MNVAKTVLMVDASSIHSVCLSMFDYNKLTKQVFFFLSRNQHITTYKTMQHRAYEATSGLV